jgi:TrmH family RNA methyltransferase
MGAELQIITSRDNRRLVFARRVRDGREPGFIFAEGRRLIAEALRSALEIEQVFVDDRFDDTRLLSGLVERCPVVSELPSKLMGSIADTETPQGIIIIAHRPEFGRQDLVTISAADVPLVLLLIEVNNPSNLGAILRTAEAAGIAGVIVSHGSADVYSPKSLRASMGAAFRLPVWSRAHINEVMIWAKDNGLAATATDATAPFSYTSIDWRVPRLLIFGSEAHGITPETLAASEQTVTIPLAKDVESLNLAVSAGIILFEARRQAKEGKSV